MSNSPAAEAIEAFLRALGFDPAVHPDLRGTGQRVASLFSDELLDGYRIDPAALLADALPEDARTDPPTSVVWLEGSDTHLICPHHLTIGEGTATVAYAPGARLVGLGVLARLVDAHTHRLVLQEDAGERIVADLLAHLGARGALCQLTIRHGCLAHHGPRKGGAEVRTLALGGSFAVGAPDHGLALSLLTRR